MVLSLDIVIPVLNEAETLENQISKLARFIENHDELTFKYQITIADNGSSDSTLDLASEIKETPTSVRVLSVAKPGVGLALKEAWRTSTCDYVGYMDLDFSTDLSHLIEMERRFREGYKFVFGSRLLPESIVTGRGFKREITTRVFNALIRRIFHSSISDGMCGFKFFKRELIEDLFRVGADCDGWFYCTEITVAAQLTESRIFEMPVTWRDDAESKVRIPSLTIEYLGDILKFKKRIKASANGRQVHA